MRSNRKSIDAGLIMQKSMIAKKLVIKDEDLLFMILELSKKVITLSCHVQASFIGKKDKYLHR